MSLLTGLIPFAIDTEGRTYPGAFLYSYDVGTNTPKATYSNAGLTVANANPLEADGAGRFFNVYLGSGGYKLVLRDANDVVVWTQDNYYQALDGADMTTLEGLIDAAEQQTARGFVVYTDSGVADAYVLAVTGAPVDPTAYEVGMVIVFKPTNANTGASTVNVAGLGLKNLYDQSGSALTAGFLETGKYYSFVYEAGNFRYLSRSGLVSAGGIATDAVVTAKVLDKNITLAKIADGTAHELVSHDSSGVITEVTNPMRLLSSGSITSAASLDFVLSTLQTSQAITNAYLIKLVGFQQATTNDLNLYMTFSTDAGSTWVATNYDGVCFGYDSGVAALRIINAALGGNCPIGATAATFSFSNAANETGTLELRLYNFNTGTSIRPTVIGDVGYFNSVSDFTRSNIAYSNTTAGDYDAIRFTWETGVNFAAVGQYYIYAIPNTI